MLRKLEPGKAYYAVVCNTNGCCYSISRSKANAKKFKHRRLMEVSSYPPVENQWSIWKVIDYKLIEEVK